MECINLIISLLSNISYFIRFDFDRIFSTYILFIYICLFIYFTLYYHFIAFRINYQEVTCSFVHIFSSRTF